MKNLLATITFLCFVSTASAGIKLIPSYSGGAYPGTSDSGSITTLSSTNIVFVAGGSSVARVSTDFNIYNLEVAGSTSLDVDLSALNFENKQYTFEVQCHMLSSENCLTLPSTNTCYYLGGLPDLSVVSNQTIYISFRAESASSLIANVWLVK